ncbi:MULTISPECIES: deoxyribodipyrimidine photo-lyase [unclassified Methylobacterium]|uniref:deoxyribodipyrimidine photo-lyase n=1 Tax=unclassified Methylobacterium TaxID=2615210 RepID=UPI0006F9BFFF|nr:MULTISPECIES: deoxyribodipyrimidine photo-lyase [unclassified Methylobacterium]KQO50906.1 deoxyribodipyrimidine photolyase [Methylobacterium sp. Leaf86]KQO91561.1 deoxyribodipyrimidine photolyase [Methylobacterium sp. Leaf91]
MAIQAKRIRDLNDAEPDADGSYVLYLLQQANRAHRNPALELAIEEANRLGLPVVVCFGLLDGANGFPEANARHYAFLLQGLADAKAGLEARGIHFVMRKASPAEIAIDLSAKAALLVLDRGYLAIQKRWYGEIAKAVTIRVVQVEGDVVVPVEVASPKHEFAARTLRPKILKLLDEYVEELKPRTVKHKAGRELPKSEIDVSDPEAVLAGMSLDREVAPVTRFTGGETEARRRLKAYLAGPFGSYGTDRNRPEAGAASHMSPYLHFGQISPVEIALAVRASKAGASEDKASYLEELVVRRELAMNHVNYTERYDSFEHAVPDWARKALAEHADDERPTLYTEAELAEGKTHDEYWNAAQAEMRVTGYMHNHLRMYWGKKILEWSPSAEEGFNRTLRLNNRYFLDGRDANSFTNVAWVYGLHDRPWARRPIFGTVRYQSENSLRKFDAKAYLKTVRELCQAEEKAGKTPRKTS